MEINIEGKMNYITLNNNIALYHGTNSNIDIFDIEEARRAVAGHHEFQGCLFFALNKELSERFGKNIYKVLPNGLTALNLGNYEQVQEFANYFLNEIEKIFANETLLRPCIKTDDFIINCLIIKGYICDLPNEIINLSEADGQEVTEEQEIRIKKAILDILPDFVMDTMGVYPEFMLLKNAHKLIIAGKCD